MKMMRGRIARILTLLLSVFAISSCSPVYTVYGKDCVIFKKVELHLLARQWLETTVPVPEFVAFLDDVADNNDRLKEHCE